MNILFDTNILIDVGSYNKIMPAQIILNVINICDFEKLVYSISQAIGDAPCLESKVQIAA